MRIAALAFTFSFASLAACGGPEASNTAQADGNTTASAAVAGSAAAVAASPLGKPVSGAKAKKLMHDRHEGMEEIGDAFKIVSREAKAERPDTAKLRANAAIIARLAPQASGWFPAGTGPDVGKTRAKREIWAKPQDFAAKTRDFQQAAKAFNAAARSGDIAAIRTAHPGLGKTCKACHDPYREPEH